MLLLSHLKHLILYLGEIFIGYRVAIILAITFAITFAITVIIITIITDNYIITITTGIISISCCGMRTRALISTITITITIIIEEATTSEVIIIMLASVSK